MQSTAGSNILKPGFTQRLLQQVNNSPLIAFRMIFGFLLCYHFLAAIFKGAIYSNFIAPPFTFTFIGFEFLQPLPGNGMYFYAGIMALFSFLILLGAWYRLATTGLAIMYTALYLMQKSDYNNHYYLLLLLCWIMVFMPANRYFAIDAKRNAVKLTNTCHRYYLWIFIAQVAIMYFFAAVAKLSSDWFSGKFIAIQFSGLTKRFLTGMLYRQEWFQLLICYGGFLFDLLIVPFLLWKRSRNYAFFVSILFHLFNSYTFSIGIFPYLSIALNLFFLNPQMIQRFFFWRQDTVIEDEHFLLANNLKRRMLLYGFCIYIFFQLIIPMRSWFYPGNVFWTEEGYRMSWKMMMRTKSGSLYFKVKDPVSKKIWKAEPAKIFSPRQMMWLSTSPDIIWQYAQRLKKEFEEKGIPNVEVYAIGKVSLNRSEPKPMVDTTVDLGSVKWKAFRHSEWITRF